MLSAFHPKLLRANFASLPPPDPTSFQDRTYIVTGANTGLGLATAKNLVALSARRVILAVRSQARGDAAVHLIEQETGRQGVAEVWLLDFASFESVTAFAQRVDLEFQGERLDGVVCNASVAMETWETVKGVEMDVMVNVLGTFLLSLLVLPRLRSSARTTGQEAYLSIVTSGAGFFEKGTLEQIKEKGVLDLVEELSREGAEMGYCITKLMQIYAVRELAALLPDDESGVVIDMVSPGLVYTDLDRHGSLATKLSLKVMRAFMGRTADVACRTVLHGVSAGREAHGKYLSECLIKEDFVPEWVKDEKGREMQRWVWGCIVRHLEAVEPGCLGKALGR
ncbi:NAD(P)-binding protein [Lophiostoma macrostomum CBS 122681]|uniref:NAD(P)-binding protein n=1 Tax=Lophiostoma macrostomum CBS 122681 TaxID=1314788 RepID=A0A6A6SVU8_9PLEO|nr:NAD(P)-binding protein [Lophiostoma macrostomum CBS 122681]